MKFHVLVPFGFVAGAVVLVGGIAFSVISAAAKLAEMIFLSAVGVAAFVFVWACLVAGVCVAGVALYRLARVFLCDLTPGLWPSVYVLGLAAGLLLFGFGFSSAFRSSLTRQVAYVAERQQPKLWIWTETVRETRYRAEPTGWATFHHVIKRSGQWMFLLGLCGIAGEAVARNWTGIKRSTALTAKQAKLALDGPTAG
jgi:hypothetical protein